MTALVEPGAILRRPQEPPKRIEGKPAVDAERFDWSSFVVMDKP